MATYIPAVRTGNLLFCLACCRCGTVNWHLSESSGVKLSLAEGAEAAKVALLNALAIAKQELGSLDRITRVVKVVGHVASAEGFTDQPQVLNGASDLLVAIFGEGDAMHVWPQEPPNCRVALLSKSK